MLERIRRELARVSAVHGALTIDPEFRWFIVNKWTLPFGWSKESTCVLILIPAGYAVTPPDNFWTDVDLCLSSGVPPGNTSIASPLDGQPWRQFSYHVEVADWRPEGGDTLLTFLGGVGSRLREAS